MSESQKPCDKRQQSDLRPVDNNYGVTRSGTSVATLKRIPIPYPLKDGYILVRVEAVALNPTDWTTLDAPGDNGTLVGCDFAGVVVDPGKAVNNVFRKGDRVAGISPGGMDANPSSGSFAKYVIAKGDICLRVPDHVSFEKAATIGSGIMTAGYALYQVLGMPTSGVQDEKIEEPILIYGGSTATGSIAVQLAKRAGRRVLTTCSPKHFDLMKQRGADEVFDYRAPDVGQRINVATKNSLTEILDCVAIESSAAICATAFGENGGTYCNLLGVDCPRSDVKSVFFLGYDLLGEPYVFEGENYLAKPEAFEFAMNWAAIAEQLWAEREWESHPEVVKDRGLNGTMEGMQLMREGKGPSGEKWVYRLSDTVWP